MGAPSQYCGAGNRLSVYAGTATPPATTTSATPVVTGLPAGWTYQGCWIDGNQGRILPYQAPDSQTNSPAACANACLEAGYTVSGTEYAVQCFCGNAIYNGGVETAESDCSTACPGAPAQICGAGNRLSIVANGPPQIYAPPAPIQIVGSWTYQGCAVDNIAGQRTFFWQLLFPGVMTPEMCLTRCAQYGYHAAGLEYGEEVSLL